MPTITRSHSGAPADQAGTEADQATREQRQPAPSGGRRGGRCLPVSVRSSTSTGEPAQAPRHSGHQGHGAQIHGLAHTSLTAHDDRSVCHRPARPPCHGPAESRHDRATYRRRDRRQQRHRRRHRPGPRRRGLPRVLRRPAYRPDRGAGRGDRRHGGRLRRHLGRVGARARRRPSAARCTCSSTTPAARSASDPVESADPEDWRAMYDVNVIGLLHVTQALLPALRASGDGGDPQRRLDGRPDRLRGRRRLHRGQARHPGGDRDAAARAGRRADPGVRDRAGHGAHRRVRAGPVRRGPRRRRTRCTPAYPTR